MARGVPGTGPYGRTDAERKSGKPIKKSVAHARKAALAAEAHQEASETLVAGMVERQLASFKTEVAVAIKAALNGSDLVDQAHREALEDQLEALGLNMVDRAEVTITLSLRGWNWDQILDPRDTIITLLGLQEPVSVEAATTADDDSWRTITWAGTDARPDDLQIEFN